MKITDVKTIRLRATIPIEGQVFSRSGVRNSRHLASSIAIFHNHPSGDPHPSHEDVLLTHQLAAAGEVMGIPVLDHLILGDGCWFSFLEAGAF